MNVWLLGLISLFTDISSEMVYPLIPLFLTTTLGASPAVLGLIEGTVESLAALVKVFSGRFSDTWGRRKPIAVSGYIFSLLGKSTLYLAGSWVVVFLGRGFDRFGKGVRGAPRDAMIAESAAPGRLGAAFGLHRLMDTLGAIIGIVIAYLLMRQLPHDFTRIFMWSLVPAALAVLVFIPVRDTVQAPKVRSGGLLPPLKDLPIEVKRFTAISLVFAIGNSSNHFLLLRAADIGFSVQLVILAYLLYNVSYAAVSYQAGKLSDRVGRKPLLLYAYGIYAFVYLGFALVSHPSMVWLLFAAYGVYAGIFEGVEKAYLIDMNPGLGKATVLGWHQTAVGLALLPASLIAGLLWKFVDPAAPFFFAGVMALIAAVLFHRFAREV